MIKRHTRPNPAKQIKGGIAERESPIAVSNVMVVVLASARPSRIAPPYRKVVRRQRRARTRVCRKMRAGRCSTGSRKYGSSTERALSAKTVVPALTKEFGYKNVMAVPKIDKISINIGLGEATQNAKLMDGAVNELGQIAGPEAGDHQGAQIHRRVQAARRHGDRLHGDAARRPHV